MSSSLEQGLTHSKYNLLAVVVIIIIIFFIIQI